MVTVVEDEPIQAVVCVRLLLAVRLDDVQGGSVMRDDDALLLGMLFGRKSV